MSETIDTNNEINIDTTLDSDTTLDTNNTENENNDTNIERCNDLLNTLMPDNQIDNDSDLRKVDMDSLSKHIKDYDDILRNYAKYVDETLSQKRKMKNMFFIVSILTMIFCVIIVAICVKCLLDNFYNPEINALNYIVPTLTAIASFLTVYIIIPKIIAKYLFNSKEDKAMKDIISSIQEYDKYIRDSLHNKNGE